MKSSGGSGGEGGSRITESLRRLVSVKAARLCRLLSGSLAIGSAPERGTRITAHIPIEEAARGQDTDPAR